MRRRTYVVVFPDPRPLVVGHGRAATASAARRLRGWLVAAIGRRIVAVIILWALNALFRRRWRLLGVLNDGRNGRKLA